MCVITLLESNCCKRMQLSSAMHSSRPCVSLSSRRRALSSISASSSKLNAELNSNRVEWASIPHSGIIAMMAAVVVSTSSAQAEELYAAGPSQYSSPSALRYAEQEEKRFDENLQTAEQRQLLDMLLQGGGNPKASDLEQARLKVNPRLWGA